MIVKTLNHLPSTPPPQIIFNNNTCYHINTKNMNGIRRDVKAMQMRLFTVGIVSVWKATYTFLNKLLNFERMTTVTVHELLTTQTMLFKFLALISAT